LAVSFELRTKGRAMPDTAAAGLWTPKTLAYHALAAPTPRPDPFLHVVYEDLLTAEASHAINLDFPAITASGFLSAETLTPHGAFAELLDDLKSNGLAQMIGAKLGMTLAERPRMITVRRWSEPRDGRIHTDSRRKIATFLVYLNERWDGGRSGALRVLRGRRNLDDYAVEIAPISGAGLAFRRCDHSWHGHLPYRGERRVVQLTYLESDAALARKERAGARQAKLKRWFGARA
jgi:hypothetical protein